ncbi:Synapsin, ATP binding domain containing protein [Acanthamoeba castellanii str. Neff]|uniref:Synapsin, ATP binding domain containing protein n=1 Tax=Acanthamoeba castellanii (strain ATCC 30010 / Neff) TaxID=1257118 RepID=L8GCF9_ACACF|nr:Synapsin, ATP binding domain containing protein [Acanthamoeba castellanii str. Neff]ELR10890.1 Synapsin, ATP binding domain containing protein [Acanthamoeba castellanii str. Neff]
MERTLLVVECQANLNWYEIFAGAKLHGEELKVEQAEWDDISVISYSDAGVVATLRRAAKPLKDTPQTTDRTITVDFVLLRSVTRGIKIQGQDSRNKLFAMMHAGLGSVNSLLSAYMCLERPTVFGELRKIQKRLGKDNFPVIEQTLYGNHREMLITPDFPIVGKVGHAHAGYGKAKLNDSEAFADFRSLCALHGDYVTVEPFIDWDWDGRIQKIGPYYRVFKRVSMNWKGNVGNMSMIEDIEMTPRYQRWIDECAQLDFVHSKTDDKEYILELNDTAIGLVHEHELEDMGQMRDIAQPRCRRRAAQGGRASAQEGEEDQQEGEERKEGEKEKKAHKKAASQEAEPEAEPEPAAKSESDEKKKEKTDKKGKEKAVGQEEGKEEEEEEGAALYRVKLLEEKVAMLELALAREKEKSTAKDHKKGKKGSSLLKLRS